MVVIPSGEVVWKCQFEAEDKDGSGSWCNIEQSNDDERDWSESPPSGRTRSEPTGPQSVLSGAYTYLEGSAPARNGDRATYESSIYENLK